MKASGSDTSGGMEPADTQGGVAAGELRQFIERVERLHEERAAIADDIHEIYAEMKGRGYSVKAARQIISLRRMDPDQRAEDEAILELYMNALGMV